MRKANFNVLLYGAITIVATQLIGNLTPADSCIIIYLSMILGALMSVAEMLERP